MYQSIGAGGGGEVILAEKTPPGSQTGLFLTGRSRSQHMS